MWRKTNIQTHTKLPHTKFLFNLDTIGHILLIGTMDFDMEVALVFLNFDEME
jgi:hypothetical protein